MEAIKYTEADPKYKIGDKLTRTRDNSTFVVSKIMDTCGGYMYGANIISGTHWTSESWVTK